MGKLAGRSGSAGAVVSCVRMSAGVAWDAAVVCRLSSVPMSVTMAMLMAMAPFAGFCACKAREGAKPTGPSVPKPWPC